jgi:hypothetical protein
MNRDPATDNIVFTQTEQNMYSVPAELTPAEAVETALELEITTKGLVERGAQQDISNAEGRHRRLRQTARAGVLGIFVSRVYELCPDEHLQAILDRESGSE